MRLVFCKMKSIVVATILVAFVLFSAAAATEKLHYHLHFTKSDSSSRIQSIISALITSLSQQGHDNVELHIHFDGHRNDSSESELRDLGDEDLMSQLRNEVDKVKEDIDKSLQDLKINDTKEIKEDPQSISEIGINHMKKGIAYSQLNIHNAIQKTQDAFDQVKEQIRSIRLPQITIPKLVEPIISISKLTVKLIPCGISLQKAIPSLLAFAKAASVNNAAEAVQQLFGVLKFMPEIFEKCIRKIFSIPTDTMNTEQCAADIVGLTAIFGQFILAPENVIMTASNLHTLVELVPKTIADCTGVNS